MAIKEIKSKAVLDFDGFWTEYTMYLNEDTGIYFTVLGDRDYFDEESYDADWETESEDEIEEWWDSITDDYFYEDSVRYARNLEEGLIEDDSYKAYI